MHCIVNLSYFVSTCLMGAVCPLQGVQPRQLPPGVQDGVRRDEHERLNGHLRTLVPSHGGIQYFCIGGEQSDRPEDLLPVGDQGVLGTVIKGKVQGDHSGCS